MAQGKKTGGRQAGTPNKVTRNLREAILEAARNADPTGNRSIEGYLAWAATKAPGPYLSLMGKLVPAKVTADVQQPRFSKEHIDGIVAAALRADH